MCKEHPLIRRWQNAQATLNGWLSISHAFSAEIMSHQGFDSLTIDMQHGVSDYADVITMLPAIQSTETSALVRIPWLTAEHVMKTLDAGASGIICPMINSVEDAKNLVKYAYYPPTGERSFGPIRAKFLGGKDYARYANSRLLLIAMIETQQALANLEEILGVSGIDAIYIGPADLSLNLGLTPKFDQTAPLFMEKLNIIINKVKASGKYLGIHNASNHYAERMITMGFDFVTIGSKANFIINGATNVVLQFKKARKQQIEETGKADNY
ncbi:MAG: HpcH/HpaI aldolase family protein [Ostreibacterium sp.]